MDDDERRLIVGKFEELQNQLTHATLKWFTIGIVTGIGIWEGAKWVVGRLTGGW